MPRPAPTPAVFAAALLATVGCVRSTPDRTPAELTAVTVGDAGEEFPADEDVGRYRVKLDTTAGDVLIEVHPAWAPAAAKHFRELVESGYYDGNTFWRIEPGFVVQWGLAGDPAVTARWKERTIPDEPVRVDNTRGRLSFAKSGAPDSASTQVFVNFQHNESLDSKFSPFAEVVGGMDVFEKLYQYRKDPPDQTQIALRGDEYLGRRHEKLDRIKTAKVVEAGE